MRFKSLLTFVFVLLASLNVYGYEIISSKTEVSPGCEGGILYQSISVIRGACLSQEEQEPEDELPIDMDLMSDEFYEDKSGDDHISTPMCRL